MSDARIERERTAAMGDALDRVGAAFGEGALSVLVQTTVDASYPTDPNAFYAVNPVEVDGTEGEGDAATFTADETRTFHAFNLGSSVPPLGTVAVAHLRSGRWFFTFNCCVT